MEDEECLRKKVKDYKGNIEIVKLFKDGDTDVNHICMNGISYDVGWSGKNDRENNKCV